MQAPAVVGRRLSRGLILLALVALSAPAASTAQEVGVPDAPVDVVSQAQPAAGGNGVEAAQDDHEHTTPTETTPTETTPTETTPTETAPTETTPTETNQEHENHEQGGQQEESGGGGGGGGGGGHDHESDDQGVAGTSHSGHTTATGTTHVGHAGHAGHLAHTGLGAWALGLIGVGLLGSGFLLRRWIPSHVRVPQLAAAVGPAPWAELLERRRAGR